MASKFTHFAKRALRDPSAEGVSGRVPVDCSRIETTPTVQSEKDSSNINTIVGRFLKNGFLGNVRPGAPNVPLRGPGDLPYLGMFDLSEFPDYQEARLIVARARERFDTLPARVRERFKNNVSEFVSFVSDKKNLPEMVVLGLAVPRPAKAAAAAAAGDGGTAGDPPPAGGGKGSKEPVKPPKGGAE